MGWNDLEKRLAERFGLGAKPLITKRLYRRLQREANAHGEAVMLIISECAEASITARSDAGAWFRAAVAARLRENGFLLPEVQQKQIEQVDAVKRRVLAAIGNAAGDRQDLHSKGGCDV
jgi:hypothetical protein